MKMFQTQIFFVLFFISLGGCALYPWKERPIPSSLPRVELEGVEINMTKADFAAARPNAVPLRFFWPDEVPKGFESKLDLSLERDVLMEDFSNNPLFSEATYTVLDGRLKNIALIREANLSEVDSMRQEIALACIAEWGWNFVREVHLHHYGLRDVDLLAMAWHEPHAVKFVAMELDSVYRDRRSIVVGIKARSLYDRSKESKKDLSKVEIEELFKKHGLDDEALERARKDLK